MKDLHSHLLFGIDDGSKSIEESIYLIEEAAKQGITEMVITPHYMEETNYNCNNRKKKQLFKQLKSRVEKENIDIKLYLGNEVFLSENILKLLKKGEILTINNSKYILIEFPLANHYNNTENILFEIINNGYIPIVAHPERYRIFHNNPEEIVKYVNMGVLFQGNYMSLYGKYGIMAEKNLKYFLKNGYISFLGSDVHHNEDYKLKKIRKHLKSIVKSEEKVNDLLENNFDIVINNKEFSINKED